METDLNLKEDNKPFDPSDRAYKGKLWAQVTIDSQPRIYVFWKRLLFLLVATAIIGWFASAGVVWANARFNKKFKQAGYWNIVAPWRWDIHRQEMGRFFLDQAPVELEKKDYAKALAYLRIGVARIPRDADGRRQLAILFARFGLPDQAIKTLEDGLQYNSTDIASLRLLFNLLFQTQQDHRALAIAAKILPSKIDREPAHHFVALQAATAYYNRGGYDQAEQIIKQWSLRGSIDGCLLLSNMDWERGDRRSALQRLKAYLNRFGPQEALLHQMVRYYHENGQNDKALEYCNLRKFVTPDEPAPLVDTIYCLYLDNNRRETADAIDQFIAAYAHNPSALLMLASFGVDSGNVALIRKLGKLMPAEAAQGKRMITYAIIQSQLQIQDYDGALASADGELAPAESTKDNIPAPMLAGLQAVALYAKGNAEDAALKLKLFLGQPNLLSYDAVALARQLRQINADSAAREVLVKAVRIDYLNQKAVTDLIALDAANNNRQGLIEYLPKLLTMRKPSKAVLKEALLALDPITDGDMAHTVTLALSKAQDQSTDAAF